MLVDVKARSLEIATTGISTFTAICSARCAEFRSVATTPMTSGIVHQLHKLTGRLAPGRFRRDADHLIAGAAQAGGQRLGTWTKQHDLPQRLRPSRMSAGPLYSTPADAHRGIRLLHAVAAISHLAVVHFTQIQRGNVLGIGIEHHFAGDAFVMLQCVQRISNLTAVEARRGRWRPGECSCVSKASAENESVLA